MSSENTTIQLTIPARAEYIALGRLALTGIARVRQLPEETLADLKLALTEACSNSVRHAYDSGDGTVELVYELSPEALAIEIRDEGSGFKPPSTLDDVNVYAEGGLGIAIIRAIVDELEISEKQGGGSRLRFVKKLAD